MKNTLYYVEKSKEILKIRADFHKQTDIIKFMYEWDEICEKLRKKVKKNDN